jgi:hypothetical protein
MPTLLILRMVNTQIRQLVLTHQFWRDPGSDFDSLVKTAFADLTEKPTVWLDSRRVL